MSTPAHGAHPGARKLRKRSTTRTPPSSSSAVDGRTDVERGSAAGRPSAADAGQPAERVWQPPAFIVRMHPCPTCGALPGQPCSRDRYRRVGDAGRMTRLETERKRHHMARVELAWPDELRQPCVERPLFPVPSRNHAGPNGPVATAVAGPR